MPSTVGKPKTRLRKQVIPGRVKRPIDSLFGSGARVDVLWCMLNNPKVGLLLSEIVSLSGRDIKDVSRALKTLTSPEIGMIKATRRNAQTGITRYYLNHDHPWVPPLRLILEHSIGSLEVLKDEISKWDGIEVAFVYGSFATSKQVSTSDIDIIIIGSLTSRSISRQIKKLESGINREIDFRIINPVEWKKQIDKGNHFIKSLLEKPKVFLVGNNERLEEITLIGQGES